MSMKGVASLSALLLFASAMPISAAWLASCQGSVRLELWDKSDEHPGYTATFIVKAEDGREFKLTRESDGGWATATWPEDFGDDAQAYVLMHYSWRAEVGGKQIVGGGSLGPRSSSLKSQRSRKDSWNAFVRFRGGRMIMSSAAFVDPVLPWFS